MSMPKPAQVSTRLGNRSSTWLAVQMAQIQEDAGVAAGLHLLVDAAGHHVPRRQVGQRMVARHEPFAARLIRHGALAPHGLADQEALGLGMVEAGGMELDEFQVAQLGAGPEGHGQAVAGGDVRIAGVAVDLAAAAGGQHHRVGQVGLPVQGPPVQDQAADHPVALGPVQAQHHRP